MRILKLLAVFVLFAVISIPGAANAQTQRAGTFTISPMLGGFYWDKDEHVGNGPEYGIGVGYNFTDHFGTEFMFNFADPGTDSGLRRRGYKPTSISSGRRLSLQKTLDIRSLRCRGRRS